MYRVAPKKLHTSNFHFYISQLVWQHTFGESENESMLLKLCTSEHFYQNYSNRTVFVKVMLKFKFAIVRFLGPPCTVRVDRGNVTT